MALIIIFVKIVLVLLCRASHYRETRAIAHAHTLNLALYTDRARNWKSRTLANSRAWFIAPQSKSSWHRRLTAQYASVDWIIIFLFAKWRPFSFSDSPSKSTSNDSSGVQSDTDQNSGKQPALEISSTTLETFVSPVNPSQTAVPVELDFSENKRVTQAIEKPPPLFAKIENTTPKKNKADVQPYQCDKCHRAFKSLEKLTSHQNNHKNYIHKCDICGQLYPKKLLLDNHKKRSHGKVSIYVEIENTIKGILRLKLSKYLRLPRARIFSHTQKIFFWVFIKTFS